MMRYDHHRIVASSRDVTLVIIIDAIIIIMRRDPRRLSVARDDDPRMHSDTHGREYCDPSRRTGATYYRVEL